MTDLPDNRQHRDDVLTEGEQVPFRGDYATVAERRVVSELPDDLESTRLPAGYTAVENDDDADYVLLVIEYEHSEGNTRAVTWTATELVRSLQMHYSQHGHPTVNARADADGPGRSGMIGAQTPATGKNELDAKQARDLARFLRGFAEFAPLYALLGGVESPEDMRSVADALGRAADVQDIGNRRDD